jgi:GxxExxY protein
MRGDELLEDRTSAGIIGAFYAVYNTLGFGFLEQAYSLALERELLARGHTVSREFTVIVMYKGEPLIRHRLDMVVDEKVVVETKSTVRLPLFSKRQTLNYLRASSLTVGFVLHFGPVADFHRLVHTRKNVI